MESVVAFDCKEFNIPGRERDFFAPIGIGLRIRDRKAFQKEYRTSIASSVSEHSINLKRSVLDSYTIRKILGGEDAFVRFYENLLSDLRPHIEFAHIFYSIIPPRKVKRLFVYGERAEVKDPVDFLKEHNAGFVALCGWKYSEIVPQEARADEVCLDYFEAKHTKAWDALSTLKPKLFVRGDTCNPCIATADGILSMIDKSLKRNFYYDGLKLGDTSIRHALKSLGIPGEPAFIGQPDLRKIVPDSRDQVVTRDFIAHPVFFICTENRPEGISNQDYREMIEYMPVMDQIVEKACDTGGSIKFYDPTTDYMSARPEDFFAHYGERGKAFCRELKRHIPLTELDMSLDPQE